VTSQELDVDVVVVVFRRRVSIFSSASVIYHQRL